MGPLTLLALSIVLRGDPARVVLRERDRVELQIPVPGASADATVEVWSSIGTVTHLRRESRELFRATWRAPAERYPQVALLSATVRSGGAQERAWLALPLIASETLQVTTKPRSRVELSLAGASFGPVRADRTGKSRIAVLVPPGHRTAQVRVRDPFGNVNETSVDLRPPAFTQVRLLVGKERASWADAEPVQLEIFAVTADGRPAAASDLVLSADRGTLGVPQQRAPGVFRVDFRAPDSAGGSAVIRATVSREASGDKATIALLAGPPAQVRLRAQPAELTGPGEIRLSAEVVDGRGNAVPADDLRLACDAGDLEVHGTSAVLRVGETPEASKEVRVQAVSGPATGALAIPVRLAPAQTAVLRVPRSFAAGILLGGQSNLARANALSAQAEFSANPGLRGIELLGRAGWLQYAPAHSAIGGISQRGELNGLSLAVGVRASLPLRGRITLHGSLLAGALRSFGAVTLDSGPAAGLRQGTAQWAVLGIAAVGASMRAGTGRVVAELQLAHAPGRGDVSGNLGGIGVSFGYLLALR
ncbi:MAG TPA: hypothetical protein VFA79_08520 [Myxococcales bacterium]|nr:hypothetical protein [Myxococcales bacterium]